MYANNLGYSIPGEAYERKQGKPTRRLHDMQIGVTEVTDEDFPVVTAKGREKLERSITTPSDHVLAELLRDPGNASRPCKTELTKSLVTSKGKPYLKMWQSCV